MDHQRRAAEQMPRTIGRYQVQESIGYGAMGAVYKAFDPLIKRTLAIKTIRLDIPRQSPQYKSFIERFYHEARISGTLSHPNIVTLFDIGEENGVPFLAMEFAQGETIASLLEKGARFPPEKVISLVSQVASAVDYAHSKGVIHRDIKPSNLILTEGDRVKVTDFGIAKLVDAEMTQAGTLLGTPSYMSPEQAMGEKLDGRSDIFSVGVCAFEMLSGDQPFPGTNVTSILYKLVHVDPIEPTNLEMHGLVPQKWHEVFGKVLAKRPDDRYQTATAFVQDLEYCLGSWFAAMGGDALADTRPGSSSPTLVTPLVDDSVTASMPEQPFEATPPTAVMERPTDNVPATPAEEPGASLAAEARPSPVADRPEPAWDASPSRSTPLSPPPSVTAAAPQANPSSLPSSVEDDVPVTVSMKSPPKRGEATVLMSTIPAPAPSAEGEAQAKAQETAGEERSRAEPESRLEAQAAVADGGEATVLISPGKLPPASVGKARKQAQVAPLEPEVEPTVSMASPEVTLKRPAPEVTLKTPEVTLKTPTPDVTLKTPSPSPAKAAAAPAAMATPLPKAASPSPVPAPKPSAPKPPPPPAARAAASAPPAAAVPQTAKMPSPPKAVSETTPLPVRAEAPSRKRSSTGTMLTVGGAVLLIGLVAAGIVVTRRGLRPQATPQPSPSAAESVPPTPVPEAPPAAIGKLHVESQPAGANVIVNGEARGKTPLDLTDLANGTYEVKLELRGYEAKTQSVVIGPESPAGEVKVSLTRIPPAMGLADVLSTPFGATVQIDGATVGQTPLTDLKVRPGNRKFDISKDGYEPFSTTVKVETGKKTKIDAQLKEVVKATPPPLAPTPEPVDLNRVYLNVPNEVDTLARKVPGGPSASYPSDRAPRLRSGEQVSVTVSFVVTENGEVTDLQVVESAGKVVDEAVMAAVRGWKYSPAVKRGIKVKVRMTAKQTFRAG